MAIDDWGGVAVAEPPKQDDWGGVPVQAKDDWGGTAVAEVSDSDIAALQKGPESTGSENLSEFLTKSSPTLPEFGTPFTGEPLAFENEAVQSKEDFERAYQTPIVTLPKPENTGIVSGVTRGLETGVESQFTGFNAALLAGLPHLPASAQRLVSAGFGVHMIQGAYDQFEEALKATTPGEKAEKFTEALTSLLFGGLAGKQALSRPGGGGATPRERAGTMTQEQVDSTLTPKVIREGQTQVLLDESGYRQEPLSREVQKANPEVIDNLVISREKLSENFNTLPEEIRAERQKSLDDIDAQLLQMDRGAVQAAEARVRERGLSKAQAEPAAPPDTTGGPPENTGRSKLFEQARKESGITEPVVEATAPEQASPTVTPETPTTVEIDPVMAKSAMDSANTIADSVTRGQPTTVRDAAYNAALDNAMSSLRSGKNPSASFMRKSAQEAAGKASEQTGRSIDEESVSEPVAAQPEPANTDAVSVMNQAIDKVLTPRDAQILRDVQEMSMESAGAKHGITKQAVSQIVQKSMQKVRAEMEATGVTKEDVDFGTERQSALPEELRTDPEVADRLREAPMKRMGYEEGGALGGAGGGKRVVSPVGKTPTGSRDFIRIGSAPERLFHGLLTDGVADVLAKQKNPTAKILAKATRRQVDLDQELYGQLVSEVDRATKGMSSKRINSAIEELEPYIAAKENGRPLPQISTVARNLLAAWENIAERTGLISEAHGVQVYDPNINGYRPMHRIGREYIPRMFKPEVQRVLSDPGKNPALFNQLAADLAAKRGIPIEDAATELRRVSGRFSSNDFMGNIELARTGQMPESFYDYNLGNLMSRYIPQFSERMSQIISYGQRLGPREAPLRENLWDKAMKEAEGDYTQNWLREAEDQATGLKSRGGFAKAALRAQASATGLLLASPTTVSRNLLSGVASTSELLGIRRSTKELLNTVKSSQAKMDAREIGAIRDDLGNFLHADQLGDSTLDNAIRGTTNQLLELSQYNRSEAFVRSHAAATASSFARDAVKELNKNPTSSKSKEALGLMQRMDVDPQKIVSENADWKTGPETRKFIRTVIRESQGGYRFDQVPLWANSPAGRFFYQFGRWGTQRSRNIWKNMVQPAIGEEVQWNGKTMVNRDIKPLAKMILGTVALGEAFAGVSNALFSRDRKDASVKEISEAMNEDEKRAAIMAGERVTNDLIMSGMLGIWSQPLDFAKSLKDQSRFKNPAEPPGLAPTKAFVDAGQALLDQGTLTKQDMMRFFGSIVPGVKQFSDVARNIFDEDFYEAQNDVRTLRSSASRWAQANKIDVPKTAVSDIRKSVNAPFFEPVYEALLIGDAQSARYLASKFVDQSQDKTKARATMKTSVKGRQPFRVGPFTNEDFKGDFMAWAQKNLPKQDAEQVRRVQARYEAAAKAAGLW